MFIFHTFVGMESILDTITRMSSSCGATGVIPLAAFQNERRRLDNEELTSLRVSGDIAARRLVNGFGIELIKK